MLADDLLADKILPGLYDGLDKVFARIRAAQKYTLSKEFTVAADGLVENTVELCKILPYCRLPYPATWIEWINDDRPHWDPEGPHKARRIDIKRHQMAPQRCALFLEQESDFSGHWKAHLFWSLKQMPDVESTKMNGSLGAITIDTRKFISKPDALHSLGTAWDARCQADFGNKFLVMAEIASPGIATRLAEYVAEDWGGEIRFMIAVLGLLNTRNVTRFEFTDKKALNAKRLKHKKQPLFSHYTLKIRPELWIARGSGAGAGDHRDLRFHFVSGHFKHRKTGLFWWNYHARGTKKLGKIEKDYQL